MYMWAVNNTTSKDSKMTLPTKYFLGKPSAPGILAARMQMIAEGTPTRHFEFIFPEAPLTVAGLSQPWKPKSKRDAR